MQIRIVGGLWALLGVSSIASSLAWGLKASPFWIVYHVLKIAAGTGVIQKKEWARRMLLLIALIAAVIGVYLAFHGASPTIQMCFDADCGGDPSWCRSGCTMGIFALVGASMQAAPGMFTIWFLTRKTVREAYTIGQDASAG